MTNAAPPPGNGAEPTIGGDGSALRWRGLSSACLRWTTRASSAMGLTRVRAVTGELIRRLAEGPSHWRAFADAELWVNSGVWEDVRERVRTTMTDLHSAARPPRSAGSVHVSATAMLFEVDAEASDTRVTAGERSR